jgi:hypothetical protein
VHGIGPRRRALASCYAVVPGLAAQGALQGAKEWGRGHGEEGEVERDWA